MQVGDVLLGEVVEVRTFAAFVDIGGVAPSILHARNVSWRRVKSVHDVLQVGDKIKVRGAVRRGAVRSAAVRALPACGGRGEHSLMMYGWLSSRYDYRVHRLFGRGLAPPCCHSRLR